VAGSPAVGFVVSWQSRNEDGSNTGVFARRFDAIGPRSSEFRVNSYTTGSQHGPEIALGTLEDFVIGWMSTDQDGSSEGTFAQRYEDLIFADDFDAGTIGRWSSSYADGIDLHASEEAALAGTAAGLEGLVDDTTSLFVQDDTPINERRYRARFYFDPNGFDPGEAEGHRRLRLFLAFTEFPTRRVAAIVLRRMGGVYAVMGRARRDDDTQADTPFTTISDGPHAIEIDLQPSSAPDTANGVFEIWVDGVSRGRLTSLANSEAGVDFVRMGAMAVKTGANGTPRWDEFVSRRLRPIGLLP
jgi:hypothetical protein